jgi:hypothetical protein
MMNSVLWVLMPFLKFFSSVASFFSPHHWSPIPVHCSHCLSSSYTGLIHSTWRSSTTALAQHLRSSTAVIVPSPSFITSVATPHAVRRFVGTVSRWHLPCMPLFSQFFIFLVVPVLLRRISRFSVSLSPFRFVYTARTWPRDFRGLAEPLPNQTSQLSPSYNISVVTCQIDLMFRQDVDGTT